MFTPWGPKLELAPFVCKNPKGTTRSSRDSNSGALVREAENLSMHNVIDWNPCRKINIVSALTFYWVSFISNKYFNT